MNASIQMEIHGIQNGTDSLTGKDGEVLVVTFADGTVVRSALSQKSLMQILRMKLQQSGRATPVVAAIPLAESESA